MSTVYTMKSYLVISPPTAPATPTIKELSNALDSVVDWYSLGIKLGMKVHELATIEKNYHGDNERCKLETLNHCLESGKLPTWKVVTDALHLMGKHEVGLKIRAKYCSSSTESTDVVDTAGMCPFVCLELRINQLAIPLELQKGC